MIKPIYSRRWDRFWSWYVRRIIKKDFSRFEYDATFVVQRDRAQLVVANHFSWWDGFLQYRLNDLLFKKRFHAMGLEQVLEERPVLRTLGGFSVKKGSRGVIESLDYAASLLEAPENMVLVFPQGVLQSIHVAEPAFEAGLRRIVRNVQRPIQVVFSVALVDYASRRKPMVCLHLASYSAQADTEPDLKVAFLEHYDRAKATQARRLYEPTVIEAAASQASRED